MSRGAAPHILLAVALTGAAWLLLGVAAALLLAGIVAMTAAARTLPGIRSPFVALATALVINIATMTVLAIVAAVLPFRGMFSTTALAILAIPLTAGLIMLAARRQSPPTAPPDDGGAIYFMWSVLGLVIAGVGLLALRGSYYGFAWAMSGDASSHISIAHSIIVHHGLTLHQIRSYPPVADLLLAVVSGAAGRHGLSPVGLLQHDGRALAAVMALMTCGVALLLAGCVWHMVDALGRATVRARAVVYVVMFAAAASAVTEAGMGIGIFGGYVSGVGGVLLELATLVLAIATLVEPRPITLVLAFCAAALTLMTWVVIGIIVMSVVAVATLRLLLAARGDDGGGRSPAVWAAVIGVIGGVVVVVVGVAATAHSLAAVLVQPGGFPDVVPWVLVPFVAAAVIGVGLTFRGPAKWVFGTALVIGVATLLTWAILTTVLRAPGLSRYYELKILWLQAAALLWVPLALILLVVLRYRTASPRQWVPSLVGVALVVAVVVSYNHVQVSTSRDFNPLTWIYSGGALPNQDQLSQLLTLSGSGHPVVVWDVRRESDSSAVLNLLSVQLFAAVTDRGQAVVTDPAYDLPETAPVLAFRRWAVSRYPAVARGRPVTVLCELLAKVPQVVVVTAQTDLPGKLASACPADAGRVVLFARAS